MIHYLFYSCQCVTADFNWLSDFHQCVLQSVQPLSGQNPPVHGVSRPLSCSCRDIRHLSPAALKRIKPIESMNEELLQSQKQPLQKKTRGKSAHGRNAAPPITELSLFHVPSQTDGNTVVVSQLVIHPHQGGRLQLKDLSS